jgi:alginate O-acetyltransferase complex protein AlgI
MIFSSITFLYYFLPSVLILYLIAPKKLKNYVLLLSSLIFYGWGEPKYILLILLSIVINYLLGLLIERGEGTKRAKLWLSCSVIFSLGMIGYFKYADFFIENFNTVTGLSLPALKIALPIGISFYTFQILSYTIDVYYKRIPAQKNLAYLATYVVLFPQLIAGPIVRYIDIAVALENREHTMEKCRYGINRFMLGLGKKVLIANTLGELCNTFLKVDEKTVLFYWMYAIAFTLQIYFDFSGYSDMAIGLGKIFAFDFLENFNYPYISKSITEFWRRWHISLSTWFRDYVYIPLGGNRVSKLRWLINILIVWMLTGLWHGAAWNFILWGTLFALLLMNEKLWFGKIIDKLPKVISHGYVLFFVIISFVLFDAPNLSEALGRIRSMLGMENIPVTGIQTSYYLRSYAGVLLLAIIGSTPLPKMCTEYIRKTRVGNTILNIAEPIVCIVLLLVISAYLVDGSYNPFLYFRF